jgi:hypothetical protein
MNAWQTIAAILGGGGVAGFLGSLLTGLLQRPKVRADAVSLLTDAALRQVNELQERTTAAEAAADAAAAKIRALSLEVDACTARLRYWRSAILDPSATLPELRVMVTSDPTINGRQP